VRSLTRSYFTMSRGKIKVKKVFLATLLMFLSFPFLSLVLIFSLQLAHQVVFHRYCAQQCSGSVDFGSGSCLVSYMNIF
jgi:hypothetical protein